MLARLLFQRSTMQQGTASWTLIVKIPKEMGTGKACMQVARPLVLRSISHKFLNVEIRAGRHATASGM